MPPRFVPLIPLLALVPLASCGKDVDKEASVPDATTESGEITALWAGTTCIFR